MCIYINEFSTSRIHERPYVLVDDGAVLGGREQWILHRIIGNPTKSVSLIKFMLSRSRVQFTISRHTFRVRHPLTTPALASHVYAHSSPVVRVAEDLIRRKSFCRAENPFVLFISVDENSFSTEAINPKESERHSERTRVCACMCKRIERDCWEGGVYWFS